METQKKNPANQIARECIVSALLQLIKEKPLSSITISELAARAGVSRMTFYRNYSSKEEVFSSHLQELLEKYKVEEAEQKISGKYYNRDHMAHCFRYWYRYRDFFDGLIFCGFGNVFIEYLMRFIIEKWSYDSAEERLRLISFTGSIVSLYIAWAAGGYKEPVETLAGTLEEVYKEK